MIHLPYKYAVITYIILQLILLSAFLLLSEISPSAFVLSSLSLTFMLIALYYSDKHWKKEKEKEELNV